MTRVGILSPTGILGYGFPEASLEHGLELRPDVIGVDGGSTDQGPGDLGRGSPHVSREAVQRDVELLLVGARRLGVPLLIGTAGGAGARPHVDETRDIVVEAARSLGLRFTLATIHADVDKEYLHERIDKHATAPLDGSAELTHEQVDACNQIVGVMGSEPYVAALRAGADVVIAGRSSDTAIFAALPIMRGCGVGPAWHAGKILECGASSAVPMAPADCMLAWVEDDAFEVQPAAPRLGCTPLSVAAHTMYENPSPYLLREPSGTLDTRESTFSAVDPRRVRVEHSRFLPADRYSIKLEATRQVGYRTIALGVSHDPLLIANADAYAAGIERNVALRVQQAFGASAPEYTLSIRQIGRNSAMGPLETATGASGTELGLLLSVIAPTQELADAILAIARTHGLHGELAGRGGLLSNLAFPIAPTDIPTGPVHVFALNHVVFPRTPDELFPVVLEQV